MKIDAEHLIKRKENLAKAIEYHGHLCLGQILGIHIAEAGLKAVGTNDSKKIIVYVEIDRCLADAIQILTGTRLGRRSMKLVNYGKMAATFINTETGDAYRVWVSGKIKEILGTDKIDYLKQENQYEKILELPTEDIVSIQKVIVNIPREEMPGKPLRTVFCVNCNEKIFDGKEIPSDDGPLCKACSETPYYSIADNI
jgi:formylmethanofuran dehydrogenase subunit E